MLVMIFCSKSLNILILGINLFLGLKLFTLVERVILLIMVFYQSQLIWLKEFFRAARSHRIYFY